MSVKTFFTTIFLILYLIMVSYVEGLLRVEAQLSLEVSRYLAFTQLAYIPVGIAMGWKRKWSTSFQFGRFGMLGLPMLYIVVVPYLWRVESFFPAFFITNVSVGVAAQVVFGYVLITSFTQKQKTSNEMEH
ncbi:hypothetical protein LCM20_02685 [Halobacillus litoralis]|uniref:hypothetical protein n=1 Tax=Halobacillus litoralis TaxID=45668 RepID=UPI001CD3032D|nr:hypothetical protein [Halobacillus litoralis]MCA0969497.1 hypothetical protein [Halobacillus litoralis]